MDDLNAVPIKIPDWSGLVADRDRLAAELDAAHARVTALEAVIREYVAQVESGERFNALVSSVPGLQSDDGVYPVSR